MKVYGMLENMQLELLAAAPSTTTKARVYFNTATNVGQMYMGAAFLNLDTIGVQTKAAAYSLTASDDTVLCNAATAAFNLTLPLASSCPGKKYRLKKIDSNTGHAVGFAPTGSDFIDTVNAAITVTAQFTGKLVVVSDGTSWWNIT